MIVEIDGQRFEVPDDASVEEISALTKPKPSVAKSESAARGGLQGLSLGWGDEGAAAIAAALPFLDREATAPGLSDLVKGSTGNTFGARYQRARDFYRGKNDAAQESNPKTYLTGMVAGGMAPTLVGGAPALGGGKALATALAQGAGAGAGYSTADDASGIVRDTALGAGLGLAGYGAGQVLGKGIAATARAGRDLVRQGTARAGAQAAGEVTDALASAAGKVGGEVQKGSRSVENLMRLRQSMTPQQAALYDDLVKQGVVPELQQSVAQSTLESLPGQAATIAARKAELAALQGSAPELAAARTAALASGGEAKTQFLNRALRYGPPMAGSLIGSIVGGPVGTAVGYLAGAGSRPAVRSWLRYAQNPAVQVQMGNAIQGAAESADPLVRALMQRGFPATAAAAIAAKVNEEGQ